ncbi:hypothetical protein L598_000300000870 [Mesorhizobium sp. J18]|uniref:hypothetical protein n=1 Tax=Mesorhizobium sp. J18 TaxID=935263 RepID=UPI00119A83FB|nr:hypothetical protein [Mesorhizobium sp. J18]TWG95483.1 hypothetical protein L598_000300000870 [Mesorhizobium sp. J18]
MRLLAAALLSVVIPAKALASGSISCSSEDGQASVELTVGSLPVLKIVRATLSAGGRQWHTDGSGEAAMAISQAFQDDETLRVDFTDPNVERVLAKLRLFHVVEGKDAAMAGTVQVAGDGVWPLACIGP